MTRISSNRVKANKKTLSLVIGPKLARISTNHFNINWKAGKDQNIRLNRHESVRITLISVEKPEKIKYKIK